MSKIFYGRMFLNKPGLDNQKYYPKGETNSLMSNPNDKDTLVYESDGCNLVASATSKDVANTPHYPVIDIDVPINLVPATRIGHCHLYINHPVTQQGLQEILDVLAKHGIVEQGYADACRAAGFSAVRPPWVKKTKWVV